MEKAEFWILDLVIRWFYALHDLEADYLEEDANRTSHGLTHRELVDVLYNLFQDGYLQAFRSDMPAENRPPMLRLSRAEIEAGLASEVRISFGLTELGGSRWEAMAKPSWGHFFFDSFDFKRRKGMNVLLCETSSSERRTVELWLQTKELPIVSPEWDTISPWQATYWKTLPICFRVRYRHEFRDGDAKARPDVRDDTKVYEEIGPFYEDPWTHEPRYGT